MSIYNYLLLSIKCPRCGVEAEMEADFRFGLRDLAWYHIGDRFRWEGNGVKTPNTHPDNGNYDEEAYVVCPLCKQDFWLIVSVRNDVIVDARVDIHKQPYISDESEPSPEQAAIPAMQKEWNPVTYAEKMRTGTTDVSAFFLVDSVESIQKCKQWLLLLAPYHMPDMRDSRYFEDVRKIYEAGRKIINFDFEFEWLWKERKYPGRLRCHFFDKGKYEIELWLPGVLASEVKDTFKDGREGFFCAFMPPAFYD